MEFVLKRKRRLGSESGQTTIEYLMLIAVTFGTAYLMVTGPVAAFTDRTIFTIKASIANIVQNGEIESGNVIQPGQAGHPGRPERFRALH